MITFILFVLSGWASLALGVVFADPIKSACKLLIDWAKARFSKH